MIWILGIIFGVLGIVVGIYTFRKEPKETDLNNRQVIDVLEALLENKTEWILWDMFGSLKIKDPRLEEIRKECVSLIGWSEFETNIIPKELTIHQQTKINEFLSELYVR